MRNLFTISLILTGLLPMSSKEQNRPVSWNQFEFKVKNHKWLYSIEFYQNTPVDSIKIVDLTKLTAKAYSVKFPIASYFLYPEEIQSQLLTELRGLDNTLINVKDSTIWSPLNSKKLAEA